MRGDGRARTDLRTVRAALAMVEEGHTRAHIARTFETSRRSIQRWHETRIENGPDWPTDADIAAWEKADAAAQKRRPYESRYAYQKYVNGGPVQVPALGYTRRLQALAALGWTYRDLGPLMGVTPARVGHLTHGKFTTLFPGTGEAISRVYDELCMTVPQDGPTSLGVCRVHERRRRQALGKGWVPPLAWDNIDDPDEKPAGVRESLQLTRHRNDGPDLGQVPCSRCGVVRQVREQDPFGVCGDCKPLVRSLDEVAA